MRVYLDTNTLIEAVEGRSELSDMLTSLLTARRRAAALFVTSELTLAEVLVKPMELLREDLVERYERLLQASDVMDLVPIDRSILRDAAAIRASHQSLKMLDSIHLSTAQSCGCTHFLTNDRRLKSTLPIEMVGLTLSKIENLIAALAGE